VVVQSRRQQISSDAGLLLLRQFDDSLGYTRRLAACFRDDRQDPQHSLLSMIRQRLYGILAGYEDCNDHDTLRDDPVFKILADRLPEDQALASQPTLSRFENAASTPEALLRGVDFLIDTGVERLRAKHGGSLPAHVTLDLDPTDDPCHGHQQLSLFHGYYDQYQYLPMIISEPTTRHVFLAWLRPGTLHPAKGADDDLRRVADKLRAARPGLIIHVRGDSDFGTPSMYAACEQPGFTYTFGLRTNPVLRAKAQPLMDRAVAQYQATGVKQRLFTCFTYQAESWDRARTVVAKAEAMPEGTNLRFVITSLPCAGDEQARAIYDDYVQRGACEHRMDELKNGLDADRLSCHRFMANFLRLILHAAAFNLLNAMRDHPMLPTVLRDGQPCTWRTCVIKVAATVVQSCRRVVIELAGQWPNLPLFQAAARRALLGLPGS
jgi:hypothetical protein